MSRRAVVAVPSPLGYRVMLTRNRRREIIRYKHPALAGHKDEIRQCIREPEVSQASAKDPDIHLYYRPAERGYVCVVVGGDDPEERFVVTAYFTRGIKKGQELWKK